MKNYHFLPVFLLLAMLFFPSAVWGEDGGGKVLKGSVTVERASKRLTLAEGDLLLPGDRVTASKRAEISLEGASLVLEGGTVLRLAEAGKGLELKSGALTVKAGERPIRVRFGGGDFYCRNGTGFFNAGEDGGKKLVYSAAGSVFLLRSDKVSTSVLALPAGCYLSFSSSPYGAVPVAVSKVKELPAGLDKSLVLGGGAGDARGSGFGRFLRTSGGVSVGRPDFDGRLRPGDRITVEDGATAEIAVPGGIIRVTGPASFVLNTITDPATGEKTVLVVLISGRILVEKTGDLPLYLQSSNLRARISDGSLECYRTPPTKKKRRTHFRQHGGSSTVTPLANVPREALTAVGGMTARYEDGREEVGNGRHPSRENPTGFSLTGDEGLLYDETWRMPDRGERRAFNPPAPPTTPEPKDVSPH